DPQELAFGRGVEDELARRCVALLAALGVTMAEQDEREGGERVVVGWGEGLRCGRGRARRRRDACGWRGSPGEQRGGEDRGRDGARESAEGEADARGVAGERVRGRSFGVLELRPRSR